MQSYASPSDTPWDTLWDTLLPDDRRNDRFKGIALPLSGRADSTAHALVSVDYTFAASGMQRNVQVAMVVCRALDRKLFASCVLPTH